MDNGIRRMGGVAVLVAGIGLLLWLSFGSPQQWGGDIERLVRGVLRLAGVAAISGGAWLFFSKGAGDRVR